MRITIASGKGGTGKTTVATSLAYVVAHSGRNVQLLDCDVEEPNCHIFLNPEITGTEPVNLLIPEIDPDKCNGCGDCARMCQYKAIICIKGQALTFPELCHGCGGCVLVCPEDAIKEIEHELGVVQTGNADGIAFVKGLLNVSRAMSPPIIRRVKSHIEPEPTDRLSIVDAPPGTSCPVIAAVHDSDYVLLVTEPTPFGLNDLDLAVQMIRALGLPMGVLINRSDVGDDRVETYCREQGIKILAQIPNDRRVAQSYSTGELPVTAVPGYADRFIDLLDAIETECDG